MRTLSLADNRNPPKQPTVDGTGLGDRLPVDAQFDLEPGTCSLSTSVYMLFSPQTTSIESRLKTVGWSLIGFIIHSCFHLSFTCQTKNNTAKYRRKPQISQDNDKSQPQIQECSFEAGCSSHKPESQVIPWNRTPNEILPLTRRPALNPMDSQPILFPPHPIGHQLAPPHQL